MSPMTLPWGRRRRHRPGDTGWLLTPAVVLLLVVGLVPTLYVIGIAFTDFGPAVAPRWAGLDNLFRLLGDSRFWASMRYTGMLVVLGVTAQLIAGMGIAVALDNVGPRLRRVGSTIALVPMLLAPVAVAILWRLMLRPRVGIANYALEALLGIENIAWFSSKLLATAVILVVDTWTWTPFVTVILLAAMQNVPRDSVEAARIDGASAIQLFRFITLPSIAGPMVAVAALRAVDLFKSFDLVHVLTRGGPGSATETVAYYTYIQGFTYFDLGYTAMLSVAQLLLLLLVLRAVWAVIQRKGAGV